MTREYPPGLVGVIAQDTARYSMFAASLTGLTVPPRTAIRWEFGFAVAAQMNELVRGLLATPGAEWLWVLGDDHVFAADILSRLLAHDVEIVAPLCLTRMPPYKPVMCSGWVPRDDPVHQERLRQRLDLREYPDGGLVQIHSSGSAGMLIRRGVFERMADPWFESGAISGVEIGEDFYFCDKARAAGFPLYGDLDTPLGHLTSATVWPVNGPEGWTYSFSFMGGLKLTMPPEAWAQADATLAGAAA